MSAPTEQRLRELARGVEPVKPVPPLWVALVAAVALWLVAQLFEWLLGGMPSRPAPSLRPHPGVYMAIQAGLGVAGVAALLAALAAAIPGRERIGRMGAGLALCGLGVAVGAGIWSVFSDGAVMNGAAVRECLLCMGHALSLGLASAAAACAFLAYAAALRPTPGTAWALAGGAALGAAAVHSTCASVSPLHWLLAHALAPAVGVALFTVPVAAWLARRARRA